MSTTRKTNDTKGSWLPRVPGNEAHCGYLDRGRRHRDDALDDRVEQLRRINGGGRTPAERAEWRRRELGDVAVLLECDDRRREAEARLLPPADLIKAA